MKVRLLHCADIHAGSPFYELFEQVPEDVAEDVQRAAEGVLGRIVDLAILSQVDVLSIAGDLFDEPDPPVSTQYEVTRQFKRLFEAGIPVVLCHGNHDPLVQTPLFPWPENVHVVGVREGVPDVTSVMLTIRGIHVQFAGFSFLSAELYGSQVERFHRSADADIAVALYHGQVGASAGRHKAYAAASIRDMRTNGDFDVWALGHVHRFQVLHETHPLILYPGTPQGRDVSETGLHGVVMIEINASGDTQYELHPTSAVTWQSIELDVSDRTDFDAIWSACRSQIQRHPHVHRQLVHLHLYGQTDLHEQLAGEGAREVFQSVADLEGEPTWIYRYTQACVPEMDWNVWRHSDGYLAELLQGLQEAADGTLDVAELLHEMLSQDEWQVVQDAMGTTEDVKQSILLQTRQMLLGGIRTPNLDS